MPFILDDEKVNRPVFAQFDRAKDRPAASASEKQRKFSRSRYSPATRAERYLRELRRELLGDSLASSRIVQIEKDVRLRTLYISKAKSRKSAKAADIPGLVKKALGM